MVLALKKKFMKQFNLIKMKFNNIIKNNSNNNSKWLKNTYRLLLYNNNHLQMNLMNMISLKNNS